MNCRDLFLFCRNFGGFTKPQVLESSEKTEQKFTQKLIDAKGSASSDSTKKKEEKNKIEH